MANDPRFDTHSNPYAATSDQYQYQEPPPRKRSRWTTCLIGCLGVMAVLVVLGVIAGFWIYKNWRKVVADVGSQAINEAVDSSDMPAQEKVEVKAQVARVEKAVRDGQLSLEQMAKIFEKLMQSPLMPSLVVAAVEKQYFERSGLTDEEKAQGRQSLKRFARGMMDKKIDQQGIDAVMSHVADRKGDGDWELRQKVSDDDLRSALKEAKARADAAGIPEEPEKFDPSDEIKGIIDESLNEK